MGNDDFLEAAARQARLADEPGRRPWPLPPGPWSQAETRAQLLLLHWRAEPRELERLLPPELELERFAGECWIGAAAFRVHNLRLRGLPPLPGFSSLVELELRTYVSDGERPGLWLFSLEATNRVLVEAAKRVHRLPAFHAEIRLEALEDGAYALDAERDGLRLAARVAPGASRPAAPGGFEEFVAERYALYTADGGRLYRAELHHPPSELVAARAQLEVCSLLPVPVAADPLAHLAPLQDLLVWPLEEL